MRGFPSLRGVAFEKLIAIHFFTAKLMAFLSPPVLPEDFGKSLHSNFGRFLRRLGD